MIRNAMSINILAMVKSTTTNENGTIIELPNVKGNQSSETSQSFIDFNIPVWTRTVRLVSVSAKHIARFVFLGLYDNATA